MVNEIMTYTQFFTAIELEDDKTARLHLSSGKVDPMQVYKMDGKLTTAIRSSLRKGNVKLINSLLDSHKVKVNLQDLLMATKNLEVDEGLLSKLSTHFQGLDNAMEHPENIDSFLKTFVKSNRLSTNANYDLAKKVMGCRKSQLSVEEEDDVEDDEDEEEESEEEDEEEASSSEDDDNDD